MPLLALTSHHKISVVSECLASLDASPTSLIEDSRWTYESRPGPQTAFLPQEQVKNGKKNKKAATSKSSGGGKKNGIMGNNANDFFSSSVIPSLPAVFDASSSRIFALQNGNNTISCWDTSDSATAAGPDESNDNHGDGFDASSSSSCRAALPAGRYAVSMHRLPASATRSTLMSSTSSSSADGGSCSGVAGVLDDGTLYAAVFVPSSQSQSGAALKVGHFETNCNGDDNDDGERRGGISGSSKRRSPGRKPSSCSVADFSPSDNLRHLITIVSPGGDAAAATAAAASSTTKIAATKIGTKRKGSMSSMADTTCTAVLIASFTARVVFLDEDTGALRLLRHNVSVVVGAEEEMLGGEVESHSYPPVYFSLPTEDTEDGDCMGSAEDESAFVIDPCSIQCARLDSTAMAVAFQVPSTSTNDDGSEALEDGNNSNQDGTGDENDAIEDEASWYCIHLEGRNGEVTSAPFPLEILPGYTVARIAGLAPNLVGVLSTPVEENGNGEDDDNNADSALSVASLLVYDIRRSVAVQALDLPLKGDVVSKSSQFSSWDMLSDHRDGTVAVLAESAEQSTYIAASKLIIEPADSDASIPRSLHQSTGLKRKYNLAAGIASAVSMSDNTGTSTNGALAASGLGRDIRFILPLSSATISTTDEVKDDENENGVEAIVGETMQDIDDVQVTFELDALRTFLADINISEEADEMATTFETAYDFAVSSLLGSSSLNRQLGGAHRHHLRTSAAKQSTTCMGLNSRYLPQSFVDGTFDIALSISLQIHENRGGSANKEEVSSSEALQKVGTALRVIIKLIRSGKVSARDHLAGGVMRSILLACQQIFDEMPPTSSAEESPSALSVIDSILSNSSDDIPEAILVSMLHHILCYATVKDVAVFFSSPRQQQKCQYLAPEKVQILIDQMNETSAEVLLLEKEKSTTKKGKAPSKKRKEEIDARLDELRALSSSLEAGVLSAGIHSFAERIVSYSTVNASLLRTAMVDTLVHAKRGEASAMLSVLSKLLAVPSTSKLSGRQPNARRTTSIAQWICALADAHLPALLDAKCSGQIGTARRAAAAAIGQGEALASMKNLIDNAIRLSSSTGLSAAHAKRKATGKVITYDSTGRKRLTVVQKDPERITLSRRPASAYSIERLII